MNENKLGLADIIIQRANTVNLPSFLLANGIQLKKTGKSYVMKGHDSLNIKDNGPEEVGKWYCFSTSEGGTNIDFVQKYMKKTFAESVLMLIDSKYRI